MDKIIRICLGLFIVIMVTFTGIATYTGYTETTYRNSIRGNYTYTASITTDMPLHNVTLFIPVPVDLTGNSPIVSRFSEQTVDGIPPGWETALFDTGKTTLLKVTTPAIIPPEGTSRASPYTVTFFVETTSHSAIETRDPVAKSAMFRPVQDPKERVCVQAPDGDSSRCFTFRTSLYADYRASADASVTIASSVTGRNAWTVFEPRSNEYRANISTRMQGEQHGWVVPEGMLVAGTGSYDIPAGA